MRKVLLLVSGLALASAGAFLIPSVRQEIDWRLATHKDTPEDYRKYLSRWDSGRHVVEADRRYDETHWAEAKSWDEVADAPPATRASGYEAYLSDHPKGLFRAEALARVDQLRWIEAQERDTIYAYESYLERTPAGRFVKEAEVKLSQLKKRESDTEAVQKIVDAYCEIAPLVQAVAGVEAAMQERLRSAPWTQSQVDEGDYTPSENSPTGMAHSLAQGLMRMAKSELGERALLYSTEKGCFSAAKVLIDAGTDVNARTDGVTPLMAANQRKQAPIAEILVRAGAKE